MPKDKHQCLFLKSDEDYRLRVFLNRDINSSKFLFLDAFFS